jgi:hypothetical protein
LLYVEWKSDSAGHSRSAMALLRSSCSLWGVLMLPTLSQVHFRCRDERCLFKQNHKTVLSRSVSSLDAKMCSWKVWSSYYFKPLSIIVLIFVR